MALLLGSALVSSHSLADTQSQIDRILAESTAPRGVVFEIVQGRDDALEWAIPLVNDYIRQLRQRFPNIDLAVVSHGSEQFGLMKSKQTEHASVHKAVKSLVASDIPVHVCGTHASWRDRTAGDFPDYVDVAPSGPGRIRLYEEQGYLLVLVRKPR